MKKLYTKLRLNLSTVVDISGQKSIIKGGDGETKTTERTFWECPPLRL